MDEVSDLFSAADELQIFFVIIFFCLINPEGHVKKNVNHDSMNVDFCADFLE
jgi:hypothetical protein